MKNVIVISLGGSLIVPGSVDYKYLLKFSKLIKKFSSRFKIVIVTGGGKTARTYINALSNKTKDLRLLGLVGIMATKLNARLVNGYFNIKQNIPDSLLDVKKYLEKNNIVVCGALGFQPNMTSDGDACEIAAYLNGEFINLTNVDGLYDKNPHKFKNAKLIPKISFKDFLAIVNKIKYSAGQHFVLDQAAAKIILKSKIKTVILNGNNLKNLENYLNDKNFVGTEIL